VPRRAVGSPEGAPSPANGNLTANLRANVAAESIGRALAARLREWTDDPGMKEMLSFLIARDTMHQQQWLAAIEELGDTNQSAPNDVLDEGEYEQYAYAFFGHGDEPMDPEARWLTGPSMDGKGESSFTNPAPAFGDEPELAPGPPFVHGGIEATRDADDKLAKKIQES